MKIENQISDLIIEQLAIDLIDSRITDLSEMKRKISFALSTLPPKENKIPSGGIKIQHENLLNSHALLKMRLDRVAREYKLELSIMRDKLKSIISFDEMVDLFFEIEESYFRAGLRNKKRTREEIEISYSKNNK